MGHSAGYVSRSVISRDAKMILQERIRCDIGIAYSILEAREGSPQEDSDLFPPRGSVQMCVRGITLIWRNSISVLSYCGLFGAARFWDAFQKAPTSVCSVEFFPTFSVF